MDFPYGAESHRNRDWERLDQSGPAPVAGFCNPFKGGAPEAFVLTEDETGWGHVRYLSQDPRGTGQWFLQELPGRPSTATAIVATVQGLTVCAHWTDVSGDLWRAPLTSAGIGGTVRHGLGKGIVRLAVTYHGAGRSPYTPVVYGTARQAGSRLPRLWVSSPAHPMTYYRMPEGFGSTSGFTLSMAGPDVWVVDGVREGRLQRWRGQQGTSALQGPLEYGSDDVLARSAVGAYGRVDPLAPRPLFVGQDHGLYAWAGRLGAFEVAGGEPVREAHVARQPHGKALVYMTGKDGVLRTMTAHAPFDACTLRGPVEPVSEAPRVDTAFPTLHPADRPTVFTMESAGGTLSLFSHNSAAWECHAVLGFEQPGVPHPADGRS
ncbi:conserved hypothetical protein [Streptomyces pristinaespiralis ATCC 25486]|uniref:Uncharacterized protein n=3 Tax=Streptomyces pristinaespiralis TaxID=38300 RepID=B5H8S0_STRE2|nr:hypothetical protein SPRI_2056 [Streptomyces pristinaespiralis]EDY63231.1 conserved hypothetical protein [Streptomyces pristinaespiralis ATCC 25486]